MTGLRTPTHAARRRAALAATGLVATMLPLVTGASSPATAAADCLDETHQGSFLLGFTGCDDTVPPETTLGTVTPAPNSQGYIRSKSLTVTFGGHHTDEDSGPIGYECKFDKPGAAAGWTPCTSPQTLTGLADTTTTPYSFRVRAVDSDDAAISACDSNADPLDPTCAGEEPLAPDNDDIDPTPASVAFHVDTVAPNTFITREPVDRIRPDRPVVLTPNPVLAVNSNEPAGFACTVNGAALATCGPGTVTLRNLKPGDTTFLARAVDRGGNLDPTPATASFFVPSNIKAGKGSGWKKVRAAGRFGNDYVVATRVGKVLVIKRIKKVREVRLIAAVGPKAGTVEVRVGKSQWYTVDLYAKKARIAQVLVRDEFSPPRRGAIQIRVTSLRGKKSSVRLDALVARR